MTTRPVVVTAEFVDMSPITRAGSKVVAFLHGNKELQRRLGWMDKSKPKADLDARGDGRSWTTCKYVVSKSGDACSKNSWIFFDGKGGRLKMAWPADAIEYLGRCRHKVQPEMCEEVGGAASVFQHPQDILG
ncbi:hypothetical protein B0H14DRAFT_2604259 [Mycena olivaceomarginata]|nr:hypothetical protein B0H14DRAFT_2604259 [Mycena olivaceomarginata]